DKTEEKTSEAVFSKIDIYCSFTVNISDRSSLWPCNSRAFFPEMAIKWSLIGEFLRKLGIQRDIKRLIFSSSNSVCGKPHEGSNLSASDENHPIGWFFRFAAEMWLSLYALRIMILWKPGHFG
ncbi:MAG: hypothetical protein IKY52_04530, partial [Clostridia bacterium]|nr:hypothetical protein [Clostridia bacterium]